MGVFRFRRFAVDDQGCGQKICSDSVLLGAWFLKAHPKAQSVLDIGTGSGLLALMAADLIPEAKIKAVEVEETAFKAAKENFANFSTPQRVEAIHCSFEKLSPDDTFDLIICNPPFFANGEKSSDCQRAAARHEDTLTFASLLKFATRHLNPNGYLGFISPADREQEIIFEGELAGLKLRRFCRLFTSPGKSPIRLLWEWTDSECDMRSESLEMRTGDGLYSSRYLDLVEDIYLTLK